MGNAAAKEGENGHGGPMEESDRDAVVSSGPQLAVGQMACSPPESPRNSQSPRMSAPQKKDLNITDLEAYTMTSEEAIKVKFETFESHMEEKMRSLFAEFSIWADHLARRNHNKEKLQIGETILKSMATSSLIQTLHA
ncbi:hypothetical protein B296_00023132 [Ensete ventricosum]|uniref:Uncharacterized protein n=1 Tax=Ensete ventricosum TaxID=4639 RepID=A0A426YTC0_ENSVE|nr:hypothetical protein B296_00023132 [Ensete ventricosum]